MPDVRSPTWPETLGGVLAILVAVLCLAALDVQPWRDRWGEVHYSRRDHVPPPRDRRPGYWWDEVTEGPLPGRVDIR